MEQRPADDRTTGIDFHPFSAGDVEGISQLITAMSTDGSDQRLRDKSAAYYRWMYTENPAGPAIVHSAHRHGSIVSSFAIAPKVLQIDGRLVTFGKTMDMFTHPDYQGLGLIKRCTDAVFTEAKASGMDGWYVTPSVNSYPIFTGKWGYREDFSVVYRSRVLDFGAVAGVVLRRGWAGRAVGAVVNAGRRLLPRRRVVPPAGWQVRTVAEFGPEADRLWERVRAGYRVALVRDARYLNWRYVRNPDDYTLLEFTNGDELVGILVLTTTVRRAVTVGEIVDFVCAGDGAEVLTVMVRDAVERFRAQGCAMVEAWSIPGTRTDRKLKAAGLRFARTEVKFLISPDFPDPVVYDGDAWLLTQGDGNDV